jgi:DNA polymerase-3 subunit epsilon
VLDTPLHEVTFVVVDLETTGLSATGCEITEVGAVKLRGGERLGELQTLVSPADGIPPAITALTGISDELVVDAPPIDAVLPAFLELLGPPHVPTVLVGHNVRFDVGFLDAALRARAYDELRHRCVDTAALARRLVRDEVTDLRLATLAQHLHAHTQPTHRALADARATVEVLHALLERAAGYGVVALDDLLAFPTVRPHPTSSKLRLTAGLPRGPGVYRFRDRDRVITYVAGAPNVRASARAHFAGDTRRKVPQLVHELEYVEHEPCADETEAAARAQALIDEHEPRFNARPKRRRTARRAVPATSLAAP